MHRLQSTYKITLITLALLANVTFVFGGIELNNIVKFNPYGIFNAFATIPFNIEYRATYENIVYHDIGYYFSLSRLDKYPFLNKHHLFKQSVPWTLKYSIGGWGLGGGIKKYLMTYYRNAPRGLYLSPQINFYWSKFLSDDDVLFVEDSSFTIQTGDVMHAYRFNLNTALGYQFIINDVFVIDVFGGLGFQANFWNYKLAAHESVFRQVDQINREDDPELYPEPTTKKNQQLLNGTLRLNRKTKGAGVYPYIGFDMGFTF